MSFFEIWLGFAEKWNYWDSSRPGEAEGSTERQSRDCNGREYHGLTRDDLLLISATKKGLITNE